MTLPTENRVDVFAGDGVTLVFGLSYKVMKEVDLEIRIRDLGGTVEGEGTLLTLNSDYTVSDLGEDTATVTLTTAVSALQEIEVARWVAYTQETDINNQGGFYPEVLERRFDRNVMMSQQNRDLGERNKSEITRLEDDNLLYKFGSGPTNNPVGTWEVGNTPASRTDKVLGFDTAGYPALLDAVSEDVVGLAVENFTATASQTDFALANSYSEYGWVQVFVDGLHTFSGWSLTSGGTVLTFDTPLAVDTVVTIYGSSDSVKRIIYTDVQTLLDDTALTYIGSGGVSVGDVVYVLKESFSYTVAASGATDNNVETDGGVKLYCVRPSSGFDATQWGVVPNDVNTTATLQAAIDHLLATGERFLRLPSGHFILKQIRMYDPTGGDRAQRGKFELIGAGSTYFGDLRADTDYTAFYGTRIEFQCDFAADNGIVLAANDTKQRHVGLHDMTLIYDGIGNAVDCRYCPGVEMSNVSMRIEHVSGGAIDLSDCWGGLFSRVKITTTDGLPSVAAGVTFAPSLFAGNVKFDDCVIDGFLANFHVPPGSSNFVNLILNNVWLQKFVAHALWIEGSLWNVILNNVYCEAQNGAFNHIKLDGNVKNFTIEGGFFYGGSVDTAWTTAPIIHLEGTQFITLNRIRFFRPWGTFLHMETATELTINGLSISHDGTANLPTGPMYMFTFGSGFAPKMEMNQYQIPDTSKIELHSANAVGLTQLDGEVQQLGGRFSRTVETVSISDESSWYWVNSATKPLVAMATITGSGAGKLRLPDSSLQEAGMELVFYNLAGSTQNAEIKDGSNTPTLATLTPGQKAVCVIDAVNVEWLITVHTLE